jgi:hypothetical protein
MLSQRIVACSCLGVTRPLVSGLCFEDEDYSIEYANKLRRIDDQFVIKPTENSQDSTTSGLHSISLLWHQDGSFALVHPNRQLEKDKRADSRNQEGLLVRCAPQESDFRTIISARKLGSLRVLCLLCVRPSQV